MIENEIEKERKWESFIEDLNRIPRPLLTVAIAGFFILAPLFPTRFMEIAEVYSALPSGFWLLLSVIVGFYFGGRMQTKHHAVTKQEKSKNKNTLILKDKIHKIRKKNKISLKDNVSSKENTVPKDHAIPYEVQ